MLAERVAVPKMCQKLIRIQTLRQRVHPAKCLQIHIFGVARKQPEQPLQATQAGNQLLALQAQQLADPTAVVTANGRAQALQSAEQAAAAEQGREQRRRFLTPGAGYQPGNAQMFYGNK